MGNYSDKKLLCVIKYLPQHRLTKMAFSRDIFLHLFPYENSFPRKVMSSLLATFVNRERWQTLEKHIEKSKIR